MITRQSFTRLVLAVTAAGALTAGGLATPAQAQDRDFEIADLHHHCDMGDRRACVRFGMLLEQNRDRHIEWRRSHPEFFWWEH